MITDLEKALISSGQASNPNEAKEILNDMRSRVYYKMEDPEEVLGDYNLEPDYIFDILSH